MRCLYIVGHESISPNGAGGASSIYYDQLMALAELGHEVHLWHFASQGFRDLFTRAMACEGSIWDSLQGRCRSLHFSTLDNRQTFLCRGLARIRAWLPPGLPVADWPLYCEFRQSLRRLKPDVIWAQHYEPALLAAQQSIVPVVYVHHDWLYRIKALRNQRVVNSTQRLAEERLVRTVAAVVSGSQPECEEIRRAGGRHVFYIPVSYEPVPFQPDSGSPASRRLVHLGGMGSTANREGLLAFFERVWPRLREQNLDLEVVGDTSAAPPRLQAHLGTVSRTGFVLDLASVLRPLDLHIIPWEHCTGQRTRLPLAFNHGQVVVATRASVACYPEAVDGVNCRIVDRLEDMISVIPELMDDPVRRRRLGVAARATFESHFTRPALSTRFQEVLRTSVQKPL